MYKANLANVDYAKLHATVGRAMTDLRLRLIRGERSSVNNVDSHLTLSLLRIFTILPRMPSRRTAITDATRAMLAANSQSSAAMQACKKALLLQSDGFFHGDLDETNVTRSEASDVRDLLPSLPTLMHTLQQHDGISTDTLRTAADRVLSWALVSTSPERALQVQSWRLRWMIGVGHRIIP